MKTKTYANLEELASDIGLNPEEGTLARMKAKLTNEIIKIMKNKNLTHQEVAKLTGIPRSAITGIVNGSLQKVTLDRLVRIINALGKNIEFKIKNAA